MYRLTVIASPKNAQPARGATFGVERGQVSIGRHSQNEIVLQSGNVSKKHCVLVVNNDAVVVRDQGSSNGTFVNGQLTQKKSLRPGDRISVGEFVLELTETSASSARAPAPLAGFDNVVALPLGVGSGLPNPTPAPESDPIPTSPLGKLGYYFEKFVMPYFYGLIERYEWKMVGIGLLALFVILNMVISISPLMSSQNRTMVREIAKRASVIAHEIAERNTPVFAAKQETKSELGTIGRSEAVKEAVILDMEGRIVAPAVRANQYYNRGQEAAFAAEAKRRFAKGQESGLTKKLDEETVVSVEPIKVLNPQLGKNEVVGMALVSMDTTLANPGAGELSAVYANSLIISLLVGMLIFYILYRVTLRPFELMNDQIDQALRGERGEVKSPVHFEEIDPLWTIVDSAVKRVPKGEDSVNAFGGGSSGPTMDDFLPQFQALGVALVQSGVAVLDGQGAVVYLNSAFEDLSGLRLDSVQGQSIVGSSRDQAFGSLLQDLMGRVSPGSSGVTEDFDFSGVQYKVQCVAFGSIGNVVCYLLTAVRGEHG